MRPLVRNIYVKNVRILLKFLNKVGFYLSFPVAILWVLGIFHFKTNTIIDTVSEVTLSVKLLATLGAVFLYFIPWILIKLLRNPNKELLKGMNLFNNIKLEQWLTNNVDGYKMYDAMVYYRYAVEDDIDFLSNLNYHAFEGSPYEVGLEDLKDRNLRLINKFKKSFMLVLHPILRDEVLGYSCILPLNALGLELYLRGQIEDSKINDQYIAGEGDEVEGLLYFAIHLRKEYSFEKSKASRMFSLYFIRSLFTHLENVCFSIEFAKKLNIYAQTAEKSLRNRLLKTGFVITNKKKSADGFDIFTYRLVDEGKCVLDCEMCPRK